MITNNIFHVVKKQVRTYKDRPEYKRWLEEKPNYARYTFENHLKRLHDLEVSMNAKLLNDIEINNYWNELETKLVHAVYNDNTSINTIINDFLNLIIANEGQRESITGGSLIYELLTTYYNDAYKSIKSLQESKDYWNEYIMLQYINLFDLRSSGKLNHDEREIRMNDIIQSENILHQIKSRLKIQDSYYNLKGKQ